MKKLFLILLLLCSVKVVARGQFFSYAQKGGQSISVAGFSSTTKAQRSFPGATVSVYTTGTSNLATLYSDSAGTSKANPFTASTDASFTFFVDNGTYDITFSGTGITTGCGGAGQLPCLSAFTWSGIAISTGQVGFPLSGFGARCDGTTDDTIAITAAWNAAIAVWPAARSSISVPAGDCKVTNALPTFVGIPVRVYGEGQGISGFTWAPTSGTNPALMTWQPLSNQSALNFVEADHFYIDSGSSYTKTGIRSIGTSYESHFHDLRIELFHTGDTAHEIQGWDQTALTSVFYEATYPIYIKKLTAGASVGAGSFDHFNFHNVSLFSYDDTQPLISFESGITCSNWSVSGNAIYVGGTDAIKFVSTGAFNNNSFQNIRWENGIVQSVTPVLHGYLLDIEPSVSSAELTVINCSGSSQGAQGFKFRNMQRINMIGSSFVGSWASSFTQFDADNTCDKLVFNNFALANSANAVRTIGSQLKLVSSNLESTTSGWYFTAVWEKPDASADLNNNYVSGLPQSKTLVVSLAAGASQTIASPGHLDATSGTAYSLCRIFVSAEHATKSDATFEYGTFATVYYGIALVSGSANISVTDTPAKLCVLFTGGANALTIKNNLAVPVRVKVLID